MEIAFGMSHGNATYGCKWGFRGKSLACSSLTLFTPGRKPPSELSMFLAAVLAIGAFLMLAGCRLDVSKLRPMSKVTSAVYVYERREGEVPPEVRAGISELNKTIVASTFDKDTVDGSGEVPAQFRIPLKAAVEKGLPEFVVLSGERVVRTADVKTKDDVLEAAR